jgi:pimeloyl-ACP methyl ester carboxylesterase
MKRVYKSKNSQKFLLDLYDKQLERLNVAFEDLYVETRFGKSHIIKLGNENGKPLLLFHGGNSTAPYYLEGFKNLFEHFCIYAVDTIGHPGKSAETILSAKSMEYGQWASDVITALGFEKICCLGGSYGAGILVKLMCVDPNKIEKVVLIVPSGIANISTLNVVIKMGIPMMLYILTKKEYWLKKTILFMAIEEKNIDDNTYEMVKSSFEHAVVKAGLPSNVSSKMLKQCFAPTLVIAAEEDCLFPGKKVIKKAKETIPNMNAILLHNQGHLCVVPNDVMDKVVHFINK